MKKLLLFVFMLIFSFPSFAENRELFAKTHKEIINDSDYISLGNPKGKFEIISFFDYRCHWCQQLNQQLMTLVESGKAPNVRWIPVEAPILGTSISLSEYVLAAKKQGKQKELFTQIVKENIKSPDELKPVAKKLKINFKQLNQDAKKREIQDALNKNLERHTIFDERQGIVPLLIIAKKIHIGGLTEEIIEKIIKDSNKPIYKSKK